MKRKLAFFLSLIMIFSIMAPIGAFAEQTGFTVTNGEQVTTYTTIQEAVAALVDGATLTMYEDAEITSALVITENNITIEGNGKKITVTSTSDSVRTFNLEGSTQNVAFTEGNRQKVTMQNLNIDYNSSGTNTWAITVRANVDLTLDTVKISTGVATRGFYQNAASLVTLKNSEISVTNNVIAYSIDNANAILNIENSRLTSPDRALCIYNGGTANISGTSYLEGNKDSTVQVSKGVVRINGGEFNNTGSKPALRIVESAMVDGKQSVIVSGGTFKSTSGVAINIEGSSKVKVENATVQSGVTGDYGAIVTNSSSELIINNSTVTSTNKALYLYGTSSVTINGGKYSSTSTTIITQNYAAGGASATLKITGGEFENTGTERVLAVYNAKVDISGGTFTSKSHRAIDIAGASIVNISGGTVSSTSTSEGSIHIRGTSNVTISGGNISSVGYEAVQVIETATANISGGYIYTTVNSSSGSVLGTVRLKNTANVNFYGGYIESKGNYRAVHNQDSTAVKCNIYGGTFVVHNTGGVVNLGSISYNVYGGTFINLTGSNGYTTAGSANLTNAVSVIHMAANPGDGYVKTTNNQITIGSGQKVYYNITGNRPQMEIGAAVRLLGETAPDSDTFGNGIRFISHFDKAFIDSLNAVKDEGTELSYGTLIVPTDYLDTLGLYTISRDVLSAKGYTCVDVKASNGLTTDANGSITIRAALTDLKEENLGRDFSAVAYVSYVKDGKTVYAYAAYNETNNSRSMSGVAQAALDDLKDSEQGYYKFAVDVEGVIKYSPYNEEQRATLKKYIPAAN